jgi:uncharacterized protein (DUF2132 family)
VTLPRQPDGRIAQPGAGRKMPQPKSTDPLHGVTLKRLLDELVAHHGWEEMGRRVAIRCFLFDPTIKSSLIFLRRNAWARAKVEEMYLSWKTGR